LKTEQFTTYLVDEISIQNMSEENKLKSSENDVLQYDKSKEYWQTVEPTICGMLGGLPEVGFIGELRF